MRDCANNAKDNESLLYQLILMYVDWSTVWAIVSLCIVYNVLTYKFFYA